MLYVVEIRGPNGGKASKSYEAATLQGAIRLAELELRYYPNCVITNIYQQAEWERFVDADEW